ncbi:MAG: hypothetical protein J5896_00390 [Alphaproteobacteria bacterium]|nr:hypothetical protein [Alphaproteobacteria bacterium]
MLYFFHISRDASDERLESFKNGIDSAFGTGYGGQQSGFYCWPNEEKANECYAMWATGTQAAWAKEKFGKDITLQDGNALKLKISVDESSVKYPDYQLDNEQHPSPSFGRERSIWLDFWEAHKNLLNQENLLQIAGTTYNMGFDEHNHCPVLITEDGKITNINSTLAEESFRTQAINDYLSDKYPLYRENYDRLLRAVALNESEIQIGDKIIHPQNIALKYCGKEKLMDMEISILHSNFGTDEEIINSNNARYGGYNVQYTEKVLFSSQEQIFNLNKLNDVRKKLPYSSPVLQVKTIDELRGIRSNKASKPVKQTTLDVAAVKQKTIQNEG